MEPEDAIRDLCIQLNLVPKNADKWTFTIEREKFIEVSYALGDKRVHTTIPPNVRPLFYIASMSISLKGMAAHFDMYEPLNTPDCLTTRDHFYVVHTMDGSKTGLIGVNRRDDYMATQWWIYHAASRACVYIGGQENARKLYESFLTREGGPTRFMY
tara:strand:- start:483 stop:953 length:471 start_codon:yes stop_codon:yes gene_type:complete